MFYVFKTARVLTVTENQTSKRKMELKLYY